jgi:hypothetical protein
MLARGSQYVPQASDVSEAVDRAVFDGLRQLTPLQRLQIAVAASRALHRISVAGLSRRAGALRLGAEPTRMAFGPAAEAWLE